MNKNNDLRGREPLSPRRTALIFVLAVVFAAVQAAFLSYIPLFGAVIELSAALVLICAWRYGLAIGGLVAAVSGFVLDALSGAVWSLSPLIFFGLALLAVLAAKWLLKKFIPYVILAVAASMALALVRSLEALSFGQFFVSMFAFLLPSMVMYLPGAVGRKR